MPTGLAEPGRGAGRSARDSPAACRCCTAFSTGIMTPPAPRSASWLGSFGFARWRAAPEEITDVYTTCAQQYGAEHAIRNLYSGRLTFDLEARLATVTQPTALLRGDARARRQPEMALRLQALGPAARAARLRSFPSSARWKPPPQMAAVLREELDRGRTGEMSRVVQRGKVRGIAVVTRESARQPPAFTARLMIRPLLFTILAASCSRSRAVCDQRSAQDARARGRHNRFGYKRRRGTRRRKSSRTRRRHARRHDHRRDGRDQRHHRRPRRRHADRRAPRLPAARGPAPKRITRMPRRSPGKSGFVTSPYAPVLRLCGRARVPSRHGSQRSLHAEDFPGPVSLRACIARTGRIFSWGGRCVAAAGDACHSASRPVRAPSFSDDSSTNRHPRPRPARRFARAGHAGAAARKLGWRSGRGGRSSAEQTAGDADRGSRFH